MKCKTESSNIQGNTGTQAALYQVELIFKHQLVKRKRRKQTNKSLNTNWL